MTLDEFKELLLEDFNKTRYLITACNDWEDSFEKYDFQENDEFTLNELFTPYKLAGLIYYGKYNFNDDYFVIDELGRLISYSKDDAWSYIQDNIDEIIGIFIQLFDDDNFLCYVEDDFKRNLNINVYDIDY